MTASIKKPNRSLFQYSITWVCLTVVLGAAGIGIWMWRSASNFSAEFERSILAQREQIEQRKLDKAIALAEEERLERVAVRERYDADAEVERMKWTSVIEGSTTAQLRNANAAPEISHFRLASHTPSSEVTERDTNFWSFKRLSAVTPPPVTNAQWCRNPIDQFILAKLEKAGLAPNPQADSRVLGRRLWFDLIGLPPTSKEIDSFVESGDYEQLVDQLMQNRGFGERWGRIWLDLARYADSNGYEEDELRPNAYPYRDFVIWAMNTDLPFDQFLRWQIAGDELAPNNPLAVAATGFFTAAPYNTFFPQPCERCDELDNMVSTMSSAMLGLSVGCARCHDHKFDPIPTSEYYGLTAVFAKTSRKQSYLLPDGGKEYRRWFDPVDVRQKEVNEMLLERVKNDRIDDLGHLTDAEKDIIRLPIDPDNKEQARVLALSERATLVALRHIDDDTEPLPRHRKRYDQLMKELVELEKLLPTQPPVGLTLTGSDVAKTHILDGGDLNRKQEKVNPGFLAVVTTGRPEWDEETWKTWDTIDGCGETPRPRSALARWMTDVEHGAGPLVARVIVNRLWQHHFGEGLVRTAGDFGTEGAKPTHPELLNWLANELVANDWSLKHIHRLIITSATYRQSSTINPEKRRVDPMNKLVGRHAPQRITAEMMRDTMLFTSGSLNQKQYGPGVKPPIPRDAVYETQEDAQSTWPCDYEADRPALWRRSIYVMLKRTVPVPMLRLFDAPDGSFSCQERKKTTVPTQSLALWNAPFVIKQSEQLAHRLSEATADDDQRVKQLFMLTVSRTPTDQELDAAVSYLQQSNSRTQRLAELCHVMFMSNEFSYIE